MASTCESCGGQGVTIPRGSECVTCRGDGIVRERKSVRIDIPPGVEDGMKLKMAGEGDAPTPPVPGAALPKSYRGDLIIHVRVQPHRTFERKGADILYTVTIPFTTAMLGGKIRVPTLDGEVELNIPTGTNTGQRITIPGKGMQKIGRRGMGDLKVEVKVEMPRFLTAKQRTILEVLADEMKDTTAKRAMNVSPDSSIPSSTTSDTTSSASAEKKHEGFLKGLFHKLTHHHDDDTGSESGSGFTTSGSSNTAEDNSSSEEKKASGSGSA